MRSYSSMRGVALAVGVSALAACAPTGPRGEIGKSSPRPPPADTSDSSGALAASGGTFRPPSSSPPTRNTAIVAGRPARVFIFAGVDDKCQPLPAPEVTVTRQPAQGEVTLKPGQETKLAASVGGTCIGAKATGTGVYYTARAGAKGSDSFTVTARLASGEEMSRDFTVDIAE